ncbi:MAG: acetyltransferase [Anaerolineaceae bacterium]|nr:acetyltransferase [Anaerolineaceae bacterium]
MNLQKVAIIGAGGFAREVLDVFDAVNAVQPRFDVQGYIVDAQYGKPGTLINDKPILGSLEWFQDKPDCAGICAVGASHVRFQLVNRAKALGVHFCSVIHPNAVMSRWVTIGDGTIITAGCVLTNQIKVGNHVHLNLDCTVGHDVIFGDFTTLSPGVHVSGNVTFEQGCFVGTGVNLIEKRTIGAWSIIGAGTTITKDVPANSTVVGVPGKVVKTREANWHLE